MLRPWAVPQRPLIIVQATLRPQQLFKPPNRLAPRWAVGIQRECPWCGGNGPVCNLTRKSPSRCRVASNVALVLLAFLVIAFRPVQFRRTSRAGRYTNKNDRAASRA